MFKAQYSIHKKPPPSGEINWAHPISKGILHAWLFNRSSGMILKDVVNDSDCNIINNATWKASPYGPSVDIKTGGTQRITCGTINLSLPKVSLGILVKFDDVTTNIGNLLGVEDVGPSNACMLRLGDTAGASKIQFDINIGGEKKLNSPEALINNIWYFIIGSYDGVTQALYINGRLHASAAQTGALTANTNFWIGDSPLGGRNMNGQIALAAVWNRGLLQAEAYQLTNDPFAFLSPK